MNQNELIASRLNIIWNVHIGSDDEETVKSRVDSIVSSNNHIDRLVLDEPPLDEGLGRRVSRALASNPHIREIRLVPNYYRDHTARHVTEWLTMGGGTLARFTNLEKIVFRGFDHDMSAENWDWMFRLLLTSTSLQELQIIRNGRGDRFKSALAQYLVAASSASLRSFEFVTSHSLSEAAFASLCNGVANSKLQKFTLGNNLLNEAYSATAAESLALAISRSSLEEVTVGNHMRSALLCTEHVKNLDFAFSRIENDFFLWKPLLKANLPLGLWPHILEKAHTLPEAPSLGPAGVLFYLLKEKVHFLLQQTTTHTTT